MAVLTETPWDAPLEASLGPRDSLYPLLGVAMPEKRMGLSADDKAMASGAERGGPGAAGGGAGAGGGPDEYTSYGALARDFGY